MYQSEYHAKLASGELPRYDKSGIVIRETVVPDPDPTHIQDVFGNYLKLREKLDREAIYDRVNRDQIDREDREADAVAYAKEVNDAYDAMDRVDNSADPRTDRAIEYDSLNMETPEERTARLSKIEPLMPPPNYGNRDFVRDACANAPPPMDDVGGHEVPEFKPEEGYTIKGDELLGIRAQTHGDFADNARIAQYLRTMYREEPGWKTLTPIMREALEMIAGKIARILSGHGMFSDHWEDIAGYATLVVKRLP